MQIPFDTKPAIPVAMLEKLVARELEKRGASLPPSLETPVPPAAPPAVPPLDRNPKPHKVVGWRHDGRGLDTRMFSTRESALDYARSLPWINYYRYAVMDGRDTIEARSIDAPAGLEWMTAPSDDWAPRAFK